MPGWVDEQQQAEDLACVVGVAAGHGVARIYWYDAIDDGPDRGDQEDNFGLFRTLDSLAVSAFVPKPAAGVLAALTRLTDYSSTTGSASDADDARIDRLPSGAPLAWSSGGPIGVRVSSTIRPPR